MPIFGKRHSDLAEPSPVTAAKEVNGLDWKFSLLTRNKLEAHKGLSV